MQEAQTFAIRCTVHHKPQMYMGNLRPFGCSSNNICSLVVFTVVIVQLSSFMSCTLCRMRWQNYTNYPKLQQEKRKIL